MSEHTDPTWALILWILIGAFSIGLLYCAVFVPVASAIGRAFKAGQDEPQQWTEEALERLLAATESPWLFDAPEFRETPIYADLKREQDVLFAAEVLADIDEIAGGVA